jgi:uncharacterized protein
MVPMAVETKQDIQATLRRNSARLRTLGVERLALFGSFVRGEQSHDSDVDLLVDFALGKKTFDNFIEIVFVIEELLGRRVELVTREGLSPYIGPRILREIEDVPLAA